MSEGYKNNVSAKYCQIKLTEPWAIGILRIVKTRRIEGKSLAVMQVVHT